MNIKTVAEINPRQIFGIDNPEEFSTFGMANLLQLKSLMLKTFGIADLGIIKDNKFYLLLSEDGLRQTRLAEFKKKGLATLTLMNKEFAHNPNDKMCTHTIGLVVNSPQNQYFYPSKPEILILDSLGSRYQGAQEIHNSLIEQFIRPLFPGSRVNILQKPQQVDGSLTCLNWTLANLQAVRENPGRADMLNILHKSEDLPKILETQRLFLQANT